MRSGVGWRWVLAGLFTALACTAAPSVAEACSGPAPLPPIGLPRSGATGVSTATSIVVFGRGAPTGFTLQAGGQAIPLETPVELGGGADGLSGRVTFWRLRPATTNGFLLPSTEHVLTATSQTGPAEVTRFTTAAGYDKAQGTAPVLNAVHLWRVRYPVADINSGNCVFAEYHGFITVDYVPGTHSQHGGRVGRPRVQPRAEDWRQRTDVRLHGRDAVRRGSSRPARIHRRPACGCPSWIRRVRTV